MNRPSKPPLVSNPAKKELKLRQHAIGFEKTTFDSGDYFANDVNQEVETQQTPVQGDNAFQSVALFANQTPNPYHGVSVLLKTIHDQNKEEATPPQQKPQPKCGRRQIELPWSRNETDLVEQQSTKALLKGLSYDKRKEYMGLRKHRQNKLFDSGDYFLFLDAVNNIEKVGFDPKSMALRDLGDESTADESGLDKKDRSYSSSKHKSGTNTNNSSVTMSPTKQPAKIFDPSPQKLSSNPPIDPNSAKTGSGPTFQSIGLVNITPSTKSNAAVTRTTQADSGPKPQKTNSNTKSQEKLGSEKKPTTGTSTSRLADSKQAPAEKSSGSREINSPAVPVAHSIAPVNGESKTSPSHSVVTPYFSMCQYQSGDLKSPHNDTLQNVTTIILNGTEGKSPHQKQPFEIVVNPDTEAVSAADSITVQIQKRELVKQNTAKSLSRIDEATKRQECGSEYPATQNKHSQIACESLEDSLRLTASAVKILDEISSLSGSKQPSERPGAKLRGQQNHVYQHQTEKQSAHAKSIPSAPLVDPVPSKPNQTDNRSTDVLMRVNPTKPAEKTSQEILASTKLPQPSKQNEMASNQKVMLEVPKKAAATSSSNQLSEDNGDDSNSSRDGDRDDKRGKTQSMAPPKKKGLDEVLAERKNNPRLVLANKRQYERTVFDSGDYFQNDNLSECSFQGDAESSDGEYQYAAALGLQSPNGRGGNTGMSGFSDNKLRYHK